MKPFISSMPLNSWLILLAIGILFFLMNIDCTAVNLALVPIAGEINANLNSLQWLLSGYVLIWAAFVIPSGRIADFYGKRNTLIGGLILFMIGSCLAGFASCLEMLIVGRLVQGFGAAIFTAPAWASIFILAPSEMQGFLMGIILSFCGLGLAAGPTLAGLIIEEISWRWIFYLNLPIGMLIIFILILYSPKEKSSQKQHKIDWIGALLLASGLCISVYALNKIEVWGLKSLYLWQLIFLGVMFISFSLLRDQKQSIRMIPPHLFSNKTYVAAILGEFFMAINFSMVLVMMGIYLQKTLHYSSYETGLIFIAMTVSMGLLSPVGGKLIDIFGLKRPMIFGSLLTAFAIGILSSLKADSSLLHILSGLFLVGTGLGVYFTACNIAMMRAVSPKDLNVASGIYTMFMMMGNTLSVILATNCIVLFGRNHFLQNTQANKMILSPQQQQSLIEIIAKIEYSTTQFNHFPLEKISQLLDWITAAFIHGFSINMMIGTFFAFIAAGLTLWGIESSQRLKNL